MAKLFIEGNNGGDYLKITPMGDNRVELEFGHQCIMKRQTIIPVELITSALFAAFADGYEAYLDTLVWPEDFKNQLKAQIERD